jgi:hypothetical protein
MRFKKERRDKGCPATNIVARNVARNLPSSSASENMMQGRENAPNVVEKNWSNLFPLFR